MAKGKAVPTRAVPPASLARGLLDGSGKSPVPQPEVSFVVSHKNMKLQPLGGKVQHHLELAQTPLSLRSQVSPKEVTGIHHPTQTLGFSPHSKPLPQALLGPHGTPCTSWCVGPAPAALGDGAHSVTRGLMAWASHLSTTTSTTTIPVPPATMP